MGSSYSLWDEEDYIFMVASLLLKQRNGPFLRNIIIADKKPRYFWQYSMQKIVDGQGWISASYPKSEVSGKLGVVYGGITTVLLFWDFK